MEKNYRQNNIVTSKSSKLARQQFKDETNQLAQDQKFIKKMTSRKLESGVKTVAESRLIKGRIDFAQGRMKSLSEMAEMMKNFIGTQNVPIRRADRIIATYLQEKRQGTELSI